MPRDPPNTTPQLQTPHRAQLSTQHSCKLKLIPWKMGGGERNPREAWRMQGWGIEEGDKGHPAELGATCDSSSLIQTRAMGSRTRLWGFLWRRNLPDVD